MVNFFKFCIRVKFLKYILLLLLLLLLVAPHKFMPAECSIFWAFEEMFGGFVGLLAHDA